MSGWNELRPQSGDLLKELASVIREKKGSFDTALQYHFYWSDSSSSAGEVRSGGTGTARAFDATYSALSSNDTGRLFWENSGQRLYVLTPTAVHRVGSARGVVACYHTDYTYASDRTFGLPSTAQAHYQLVQWGVVDEGLAADTAYAASFATTYADQPIVAAQVVSPTANYFLSVYSVNRSGFSYVLRLAHGSPTDPSNGGIVWRATGGIPV